MKSGEVGVKLGEVGRAKNSIGRSWVKSKWFGVKLGEVGGASDFFITRLAVRRVRTKKLEIARVVTRVIEYA